MLKGSKWLLTIKEGFALAVNTIFISSEHFYKTFRR